MKIHVDDLYDLIYRVRNRAEENELTAEEVLDAIEEEIKQMEIDSY